MNIRNPINITKSSLIGLQAELARKKEEVSYNRDYEQNKISRLELKPHIQEQLASLKPKKETKPSTALEDVDSSILDQSRDALLAKSKLYEKLRNQKVTTTIADQFLVDFKAEINVNIADENQDEDSDCESEWVTFVDSLGRSRTCLRTDLLYYKKLDSNISTSVRSETSLAKEETTQVKESSAISEEMQLWYKKREELRKIWEEEEKRLSEKKDIHYQDILFEEARMHGVGYFHFSKDEAERQEQREALNKLREETEKNQMISMTVKERREQQMKQRIEAAKKRKRERLGLPPEAEKKTEPEQHELREAKKAPDDKEDLALRIEELLQNVERSRHVRPWDIGKDGVRPRVLTQHEWNERQRSKRIGEFAPPSFYKKTSREKTNSSNFIPNGADFGSKSVPINFEYDSENDSDVKTLKRKGAEIAPPSSYEKFALPAKSKSSLIESIEMGLNRLKHEAEKKSKKVNHCVLDVNFE